MRHQREAAPRFDQKAGRAMVAATIAVVALASLTASATQAWASAPLSQPVRFEQMQLHVQSGKVTSVRFTRLTDKDTQYELSGKVAPLLMATLGTSKTAVAYDFTSAKIVSIQYRSSGGVIREEVATWQVKSLRVVHRGVKPLGGDFLQSTPGHPYP